jgi:uroporphyrinogen-III decarboxylase
LAVDALGRLVKHQIGFLEAIQAAGVRPIFFESGATPPLLPVALFEKFEAPLLARLFDACEALFGERPPCIIGGDAAPAAAMFLATRPGYVIAPSETDQRAFLKAAEAHPEVHVRVNLPATLLGGNDFAPIEAAARAAAEIARTRENTSLGCGVVPYETPPEIILRLRELILSL